MKIEYPQNPKLGEKFSYICPISGAEWVDVYWTKDGWSRTKPTDNSYRDITPEEKINRLLDLLMQGTCEL